MDRQESIQRFEQYLKRRFPGRRTPIDYISDIRQFAAHCPKPWREVTLLDIDAFVDQQRAELSQATVQRRVAALKSFFDFLAEDTGELSWPNPVRFKRHGGKLPQRLPRDLSDETVERVWQAIPAARDRAWFVLMWRAGLRVGEVVELKLTDLLSPAGADHPARLRVLGKGRKERIVLLTAEAEAVVQAWLAVRPTSDQPYVFLNERGQPLKANGVLWLLHGYGDQVGVELTPHQLRHTFARQTVEAGLPLASLGKLLGHAQLETPQRYTAGADPADQRSDRYRGCARATGQSHPAPTSPSSVGSRRRGRAAPTAPGGLAPARPAAAARLGDLGQPSTPAAPSGGAGLRPAPPAQLVAPTPTDAGSQIPGRFPALPPLRVR
jgi:site-specific recombinase XerD